MMQFSSSLLSISSIVIASTFSLVSGTPLDLNPISMSARAISPSPVNLHSAAGFVVLTKSSISIAPASLITGNVGLGSTSASLIGFSFTMDPSGVFATSPEVVGKIYATNFAPPTPANLAAATSDANTAYVDAAGRAPPDFINLGAGEIGGLTLVPGLYKWTTSVTVSAGDVTISGSSTDVWIFQMSGSLSVANGKKVILVGGALSKNMFWQVAGGATVGSGGHLEGILLSKTTGVLQTGASMNGRVLAQTTVTFQQATLTQP